MLNIKKEIKFDAERDNAFAKKVKQMPGCEIMDRCIQCGTCSGTCPVSIYMDLTPRKIIDLTRAGFKDEVLSSSTIWLCASCYACTVDCPKEIKITDVMYALKREAIKEKTYPSRFPIPVLARDFFNMVRQNGRISENKLAMGLFLKTQILKIFGMQKLGLSLMRTGRFSLKTEKIKNPGQLTKMIDYLNRNKGGK